MRQYTAVIIDIAGSRKIPVGERNRLQERLVRLNTVLNGAFAPLLAKEVEFSGGDEVQGLFYDPLYAYLYCRLLEIHMLPHTVRGGIGTGVWDIRVPSKDSAAQDGPAYHLARRAIGLAGRPKTQSLCLLFPDSVQTGLNLLINASATVRAGLSAGQLDALRLMEALYPFNASNMIKTRELAVLAPLYSGSGSLPSPMDIELSLEQNTVPEERVTVRNMVSAMAGNTGSSVQNMSRLIQKGNLLTVRSLDYYAACRLMKGMKGDGI